MTQTSINEFMDPLGYVQITGDRVDKETTTMIQVNCFHSYYSFPITVHRDAQRHAAPLLPATSGGGYRNVES